MRKLNLLLLSSLLGVTTAMALEEPDYEVVETTDDYEIRRYESFIVAQTEVPGEFDEAGNDAFRILAGYIFGNNRAATEAVETEDDGSVKMAMTAPVISSAPTADDASHTYRFVMPSKFDLSTLPIPRDARVDIEEMPERLVAVRRYSGRWSRARFAEHETALRSALERDGLQPAGEAAFARYNAPYVPWFMRRNEIMIEIGS